MLYKIYFIHHRCLSYWVLYRDIFHISSPEQRAPKKSATHNIAQGKYTSVGRGKSDVFPPVWKTGSAGIKKRKREKNNRDCLPVGKLDTIVFFFYLSEEWTVMQLTGCNSSRVSRAEGHFVCCLVCSLSVSCQHLSLCLKSVRLNWSNGCCEIKEKEKEKKWKKKMNILLFFFFGWRKRREWFLRQVVKGNSKRPGQ